MSKTIDIIKYNKLKLNRLKSIDKKNSLLNAGFSKATAEHHSGDMSVLKRVDEEILREFKANEISIDMVLKRLNEDRLLAQQKGDISTMVRCDELLGKYLAMFSDRLQTSSVESDKNQFSINRLLCLRGDKSSSEN